MGSFIEEAIYGVLKGLKYVRLREGDIEALINDYPSGCFEVFMWPNESLNGVPYPPPALFFKL